MSYQVNPDLLAPATGVMVWTVVIFSLVALAVGFALRALLKALASPRHDDETVRTLQDLRRRVDELESELFDSEAARAQLTERLHFTERLLQSRAEAGGRARE